MSYDVIVTYLDKDGQTRSETVRLTASSPRDAALQRGVIHEAEEKRRGRKNVIKVELVKAE